MARRSLHRLHAAALLSLLAVYGLHKHLRDTHKGAMATKTLGSEPVAALSRRPVSLVSPVTAARATSVTATEAKAAVANIFAPWRGSAHPSVAPVPVTAVPLVCSWWHTCYRGCGKKRLENGAIAEKNLLPKGFCWKGVGCDDERPKHNIRMLHMPTPAGTQLKKKLPLSAAAS